MQLRFPTTVFISTIAAAMFSVTAGAAELATDDEKAFYYLGMVLSDNLKVFNLSESETEAVFAGMRDKLAGEAEELDEAVYRQKLTDISQERIAANSVIEAEFAQEYIATMAAEKGAVTTETGMVYLEVVAGDGAQPEATSTVTANYSGTLRDGTEFDNSYTRGEPLTIPLNRVIPCWTEGIAMMKVGGKSKITCPANIAYGDQQSGPIPPGSALTFEVELLGIAE
jgi:FKBP-type peptidyl-prolyl cis-trans isomerase FkpA